MFNIAMTRVKSSLFGIATRFSPSSRIYDSSRDVVNLKISVSKDDEQNTLIRNKVQIIHVTNYRETGSR